jgi:DNA-directed RNA polymerase specialized sigma subunit
MNNEDVSEILTNFRSYRYAAKVGETEGYLDGAPTLYGERQRSPNRWDATRYSRIVNTVNGAVDDVLTDEQRTVINRRYLERNPLTLGQIADVLHCDRKTVQRRHKEALKQLSIALQPIERETEITPFPHRFDPDWIFKEQLEGA